MLPMCKYTRILVKIYNKLKYFKKFFPLKSDTAIYSKSINPLFKILEIKNLYSALCFMKFCKLCLPFQLNLRNFSEGISSTSSCYPGGALAQVSEGCTGAITLHSLPKSW